MKARLIKESIQHTFSPDELWVVCKRDFSDVKEINEIYTDQGDARPEAMFRNSQGYKAGTIDLTTKYQWFSLSEILDLL